MITNSIGGKPRHYRLIPEKHWEIDLEDLESQIDDTTRAILINNPSNPCGNILPISNLKGLLQIAERLVDLHQILDSSLMIPSC